MKPHNNILSGLCQPTMVDFFVEKKRGLQQAIQFILYSITCVFVSTCLLKLSASDLTNTYEWNSVRIGAGGFVTGIVSHPSNPNIRYCRTDVGNAYRWDNTLSEWIPMIVRNADGSGVPASVAVVPGVTGCSSIAIDPNNTNIVLMSFPVQRTGDQSTTYPSLLENVYRSTDGGHHFQAGNLSVAGLPNGNWRHMGERLKVDPNNSNIVYYCTSSNGLYTSFDGGVTWAPAAGTGAPTSTTVNTINVHFYKNGGTVNNPAIGQIVSSVIYVVGGSTDVYRSADGGQTWINITTGTGLSTFAGESTLDQNGVLWVPQIGSSYLWKYSGGVWTKTTVNVGSSYGPLKCVAVDPNNASRIFAISQYGAFSRSLNGGTTWTSLGSFHFANTLGWLPESPVTAGRSNGGIFFDANGELWIPQGGEGTLRYMPTAGNTETSLNWTIQSAGIEEMVARDVIIPKGSGDVAITAEDDNSGHRITNPDTFTATQLPIQNLQFLSVGSEVATCPNAPGFLGLFSTDVFNTGSTYKGWNFSGYSSNGGTSWTKFGSTPNNFAAGSIAVSRRNGWGLGSDHMVMLPSTTVSSNNGMTPFYSKDGGATWTPTTSFAVNSVFDLIYPGAIGFFNSVLTQHCLKADPFVADKYYLKLYLGGFFVSTDGGVTWNAAGSGLPNWAANAQLQVNYNLQDDLWYADGAGAATGYPHGIFHSAPGSGSVFTKVSGVDFAYSLALGAGRGLTGDAPYAVYIYGKLTGDSNWGVFRSVNAGTSWDRISFYPTGIFDRPSCMAASWDTFGLVYVGFLGNSYVYGRPAYDIFNQSFDQSTSILSYLGTTSNLFNIINQGIGGGFGISPTNDLLLTDGTDPSDHFMLASGANLVDHTGTGTALSKGLIMKGLLRPVANPNGANSTFAMLHFGAASTYQSTHALHVNILIGGTAAAPTVALWPGNGGSLPYVSASTPFWLVINKTGTNYTYTRPDGQSKTLANNKYDLWFGSNGLNGPQLNRSLDNTTVSLDSFCFQISGYYAVPGASAGIDNLQVKDMSLGTTSF